MLGTGSGWVTPTNSNPDETGSSWDKSSYAEREYPPRVNLSSRRCYPSWMIDLRAEAQSTSTNTHYLTTTATIEDEAEFLLFLQYSKWSNSRLKILAWDLNSCSETLHLWISRHFFKLNQDGTILLKMLTAKLTQHSKESIRLDRATLHTLVLKYHRNYVKKLFSYIKRCIKPLCCDRKEPSSVWSNLFQLLLKVTSEDFHSLKQ